jgi:hypothetical protein
MHKNHKLATCCYCGHRTLLRLGGTAGRHELACGACGAPLHALKSLPKRLPDAAPRGPVRSRPSEPGAGARLDPACKRKAKRKRRKSLPKRIFDFIEDAAEEVFDIFD